MSTKPTKPKFFCKTTKDSGVRAIYYSPSVGRRRIYRSGYPKPANGLKLLTYTKRENAQAVCDHTNETFNDCFVVEELPV